MAPSRIRELVRAAEASRPGIDALVHLCSLAAEGLPVDGVGLSVTGGGLPAADAPADSA